MKCVNRSYQNRGNPRERVRGYQSPDLSGLRGVGTGETKWESR